MNDHVAACRAAALDIDPPAPGAFPDGGAEAAAHAVQRQRAATSLRQPCRILYLDGDLVRPPGEATLGKPAPGSQRLSRRFGRFGASCRPALHRPQLDAQQSRRLGLGQAEAVEGMAKLPGLQSVARAPLRAGELPAESKAIALNVESYKIDSVLRSKAYMPNISGGPGRGGW